MKSQTKSSLTQFHDISIYILEHNIPRRWKGTIQRVKKSLDSGSEEANLIDYKWKTYFFSALIKV